MSATRKEGERETPVPVMFLREIVSLARLSARTAPRWIRPAVYLGHFLLSVVLTVLVLALSIPIILGTLLFRRRGLGAFSLLRKELETAWQIQSPEAALAKAAAIDRRVHDAITAAFPEQSGPRVLRWIKFIPQRVNGFRGPNIPPYGRFSMMEAGQLTWWVYETQMLLGLYADAIELCERELRPFDPSQKQVERPSEYWLLRKAKGLAALHGKGRAIEFILSHRDLEVPYVELDAYLEELRALDAESSGPDEDPAA